MWSKHSDDATAAVSKTARRWIGEVVDVGYYFAKTYHVWYLRCASNSSQADQIEHTPFYRTTQRFLFRVICVLPTVSAGELLAFGDAAAAVAVEPIATESVAVDKCY